MKTGDEAQMDADGYIKITGRIKDLIIRGGENIHPLEIENCLLACPTIVDVSVVGIPDARYGEVVAAFVIPIAGKEVVADEIKDWVKERLSHHLGEREEFCNTVHFFISRFLPSGDLETGAVLSMMIFKRSHSNKMSTFPSSDRSLSNDFLI